MIYIKGYFFALPNAFYILFFIPANADAIIIIIPPTIVCKFGISLKNNMAKAIPQTGSSPVITDTVCALMRARDFIKRECDNAVQKIPNTASKGRSLNRGRGDLIKSAGMIRKIVAKKF